MFETEYEFSKIFQQGWSVMENAIEWDRLQEKIENNFLFFDNSCFLIVHY